MEYKPTVTYTVSDGLDESLFLTLITHLRKVVYTQAVEWKRSYGRTPHTLTLDVKFLPLTNALLERNDLVTRPYYHLFWTDCNEIDAYRSSVKSGITSWLEKLKTLKIFDWMIVVVMGDGFAKVSKPKIPLVRTPVIDKIKTDFCSKNPEKIVILHDPLKESSKTTESWASLATKLANCTIISLEQAVTNYEDQVRSERERRNDKSWNFCSYFILQEELAFVFEMLSLHEEALIQYNELDAMFTQYLLNAHVGDVAHWLSSFTKPVTRWRSLSLWRRIDGESRHRLVDGTASLIDVRNYLFSRHCHLLFAVEDLKRVTELMHTFLHSSTLELDILEIDIPAGAKDCWVFMNCMEITQSLERKRDEFMKVMTDESSEICMNITNNELQLEIANLWDLARSKLLNLGELCGLMPDIETSSDNLQLVVDLISGMGDEEERDGLAKPTSLILRNALSSKENFRAEYLELSELAMGIFKHTDRYRFARNLGKDLANFYMRSGEPGKAESFFLDCVRMYNNEAWPRLNADASERLAECYKQMCNVRRYVRMCCALMCNPFLSDKKKSFYCDELRSLSTDFGDSNLPILLAVFATALSIQFNPAQTSIQHKSEQRILLRVHSKAPKPMHFHSLQLSVRHQDLSTDDSFEKSTIAETLDEEEEFDALTYTTFSSEEEDNNTELSEGSSERQVSHQAKRASGPKHLKRRRYLSGNSFDSVHVISQKTALGPDGTVKLIPIEEPITEPSKCVANRLPQMIQVAYEIDEKEDDILWAGITCRCAKILLRRQDSYQSLCSIHASTTNIVMEEYQDILEVTNVVLHPGDNIIEVPVKTVKPGHYTLRQLRFSINKIHFVLPRVLPVISYTVTKDKPRLTLTHQPKLYCNMVQDIVANLSLEDYELSGDTDNRKMFIHFPKHFKILTLKILSAHSKSGVHIMVSTTDVTIEGTKCCVELPEVPSHTVISLSMTCICSQPVALELGHRHHRRTQSAPPTTVHKHAQSNYIDYSKATQIEDTKSKGFANLDLQLPSSPFTRQNGASPVRKFLTFVREVAEKRAKSSEKSEEINEVRNTQFENDEFLEVVLDGSDIPSENGNVGHKKGHSPSAYSLDDAIRIKSSSLEKPFRSMLHNERPKPNIRQRHTLAVHDDGHADDDDNKVTCNISFILPWDDVPPVSISAIFTKLMQFSNKLLQSYSRSKRPDSTALQNIITVRVENCSPHDFFLSTCFLKSTNQCVTTVGLQKNEPRKLCPTQKATLAWKAKCSSMSPINFNVHFHADVSTNGCVTPANQVSYKFEVENVQPLYTVSMHIGADGSELVVGQMTSLSITVKRIRRDPEQEHTRGDQQLLMYHVIDTRGRWAVCGKSTGVISIPLSSIEAADLGPPVAKASLEIMPLVDGYLHRPIVVLQRYLKRRSGEFDEQLSSTESPVLKPPKLMDFRQQEIVNIDEYKQVKVYETATKRWNSSNEFNAEEPRMRKTKF